MNTSWRSVLRVTRAGVWFWFALTIGFAAVLAEAGELKLAHWMSPRHTMHARMMEPWAKEVAASSGGGLTIRIFPGGALGQGPVAQFQRAADGVVDIAFGLPGFTSSQFRRTGVIELPAVTDDATDGTNKLWTVLDRYLAPEWSRVKILALFIGEPQVLLTRDKPIRSIADFRGMKIRTPSKNQAETIEALGGSPDPMSIDKVYNALGTGVIDGALTGASALKSFKLGEVTRYITVGLPMGRSPFFLVMNKKTWEGLSSEHKALIDKTTGRALSLKAAQIYDRESLDVIEEARKSGKQQIVTLAPEEARKAIAVLVKARAKQVDDLEKEGVPAKAILSAIGIKD